MDHRDRLRLSCALPLLALAAGLISPTSAGPAAPDTWQFEMVQTWRMDRPGAKSHTRKARLWVKGKKMRREEGNMITLVANGWKYDLQKDKKQGIKQPAPAQSWQAFNIPSPARFGQMAKQKGRKVGTETIGGRRMTIYQTGPAMRVWVDPQGLAFRTAGRSPEGGSYSVEMRHLRRGMPLPDSLFQPPRGYKVNQVVMTPIPTRKPGGSPATSSGR